MSGKLAPANQALEDAILAALRDADGFPLPTSEVAARTGRGIYDSNVYRLLARLERLGKAHRQKWTGWRVVYWTLIPPGPRSRADLG